MKARVVGHSVEALVGAAMCLGNGAAMAATPVDSGTLTPPQLPFAAQASLVMPVGTVAGMPVSIVQFSTSLAPLVALEQAEASWSEGGRHPVVRAQNGPWLMLSTRRGSVTLTLQIRGQGAAGATGLLSRWGRISHEVDPLLAALQQVLPDGARVLQSFSHRDGGRQALTLTATAEGPADALWRQMTGRLSRLGFRDARGQSAAASLDDTRAGFFRNGNTQLALTLDSRRLPVAVVATLTREAP